METNPEYLIITCKECGKKAQVPYRFQGKILDLEKESGMKAVFANRYSSRMPGFICKDCEVK